MKFLKKTIKGINEYLYEHRKFKFALQCIVTLIASFLSAFCFAYGFRSFIAPDTSESLISGGVSGLAQVFVRMIEVLFNQGHTLEPNLKNNLQSILYFAINIPLFILAFVKIGKKFAIFTLFNVIFVSLLIIVIPSSWTNIFLLNDDFIARAIFAGLLTGVSSAIAVKFGHSAGGIDILSIFITIKTHSSMGKYILGFNTIIIVSFTLLNDIHSYANMALYSIVYLFTSSRVIDALCLRNKKFQLQIITSKMDMEKILISNLPHSCTIVDAKGGYKGAPKKMIYLNVAANELKLAIKLTKEIDENAFVSVLNVYNLYGRFYIKPLE